MAVGQPVVESAWHGGDQGFVIALAGGTAGELDGSRQHAFDRELGKLIASRFPSPRPGFRPSVSVPNRVPVSVPEAIKALLSPWPVERPANWTARVNMPLTANWAN